MTPPPSVQSMITIAAPLACADVVSLNERITAQLGNPAAAPLRAAVEDGTPFLHFASLYALVGGDGKQGHLVLEISADGGADVVIDEFVRRAGALFEPLFDRVTDRKPGEDIGRYWRRRQVPIGFGFGDTAGLSFAGTPDLGVQDILAEQALAAEAQQIIASLNPAMTPLAKFAAVKQALAASDTFRWAVEAVPFPVVRPSEPGVWQKVALLAPGFTRIFLWPLMVCLLPLCAWLAWPDVWVWTTPQPHGLQLWLTAARQILFFAMAVVGLMIVATFVILGLVYAAFSRGEAADPVSDNSARPDELAAMFRRENAVGFAQNHMISHTLMKPGLLRKMTIRLAFWIIARLTAINPRPGHLGDIGTIHFARWVTLPGTGDVLFMSNYGGSWESYLEDFITMAHAGLTAVWSNTVGFPRTRNLFQDGATDGERFKRFARASMIHTPFWYSAYPALTTANIRNNHLIRCGVAAPLTEDNAVEWLMRFGSAPRPAARLETTQIQSLVFGGMGFKRDGRLMVVKLGPDTDKNRVWLRGILPHIAFNDGRYATDPALVTLAVGPSGLARVGLDASALATFPAAFLGGMHAPGRERILGDVGSNHRDHWQWGADGVDVALLVYGDLAGDGQPRPIDGLDAIISGLTGAADGEIVRRQNLTRVGEHLADRKEPFGFVDGVSQPAIRGTYRGLRNDDPLHLVEPGEFVLGYPDNRGNLPPCPTMAAALDPALRLPVAGAAHGLPDGGSGNPRLVAQNGSFLVIRQLEQDADQFHTFCQHEGARLQDAFPDLPIVKDDMAAYIGAKMIGRWQDGSSLVRNPYQSASRLAELTGNDAKAVTPENDFMFGTEDPQGVRCPYGAHVRRANPRDSLSPGSDAQIEISNRHRIVRVGRGYLGEDGKTAGLMFMCLNGDIERQFEFIQQTWMGSTKFHGLGSETDPIAGRGAEGADGFTIPSRNGPISLDRLPQFVTVRGGGYFFLPGRQLLNYLADT